MSRASHLASDQVWRSPGATAEPDPPRSDERRHRLTGRVEGLVDTLAVGDRCRLIDRDGERSLAEVIGFRAGAA